MIEIKNLTKKYGPNCAVDNISFDVHDGEIVGFLGPNGAGKSTTMNILTGYLSATSGTVLIGGNDILDDPYEAKKKIGFLPEQPPLYLDMTVKEYLYFVCDLKKCRFDRKKHIEEICDVVKISHVSHRVIKHLSKGYRQRVGIAQALVGNPEVLIFDEPTVGLDPKQIIEIRNLIQSLGKKHTVILSTHILSEVQAVCDRIVIIDKGRLIANEKTCDISKIITNSEKYCFKICGEEKEIEKLLKSVPGVRSADSLGEKEPGCISFVVDSESGVDVRKSVFNALAAKSLPIMGLESINKSLEEIFIELVR